MSLSCLQDLQGSLLKICPIWSTPYSVLLVKLLKIEVPDLFILFPECRMSRLEDRKRDFPVWPLLSLIRVPEIISFLHDTRFGTKDALMLRSSFPTPRFHICPSRFRFSVQMLGQYCGNGKAAGHGPGTLTMGLHTYGVQSTKLTSDASCSPHH
jgi:hypothetical protein